MKIYGQGFQYDCDLINSTGQYNNTHLEDSDKRHQAESRFRLMIAP